MGLASKECGVALPAMEGVKQAEAFFFFLSLFIYFVRERESMYVCKWGMGGWGKRERERGREEIPSSLQTVSTELDIRLHPLNCEITT